MNSPTVLSPTRTLVSTLAPAGPSPHSFGGPLGIDVDGWAAGYPLPHRVVTIDLSDPVFGLQRGSVPRLPLLYAFRIDACAMSYRITTATTVELVSCQGKPEADWPYPGYPGQFPRIPLRFDPVDSVPPANAHGERPEPGELLVVVPCSPAYGVSLWGEDGDAEGVQVLFRVAVTDRIVTAWNVCS